MAIHYASPPENSRQIAQAGLERLAKFAQEARAVDLMALQADNLELSVPHAMHTVLLDDLVARRPLGDSAVTGWRYLASRGSRVLASSELSAGTDGQSIALEQVNMGPYVESTAQALEDLAENHEIRAGDYELRILKIPALCAVALWLSPVGSERSLFVPLAPAPDYLEAGRIYLENEMLDALEGPARLRLEFDDSRNEPYGEG
ncbi:hypothetical protein ACFQ7O_18495 [Streptomyces sp. NPDC056485]|uniref:hypothetical protein n=1 Tax=Streptomyces sp. NPDC056485 TaxID=3345834 RepID=UPI00368C870B